MNPTRPPLPALRGGLLALLAAVLFGISTPLVQRLGAGIGALTTAALLYAGAARVGAASRHRVEREARLRRGDLPRLLAMAALGTGTTALLAWLAGEPVPGALALGDRAPGWPMAVGGALMLAGVVLHLAESHGHEHAHDDVVHEHAHRHDDGHHDHAHDDAQGPPPSGLHSHPHHHPVLRHAHPHMPDSHPAHRH